MTPTTHDDATTPQHGATTFARAALCASAFVLAALIVLQLGAGRGTPASASTVAAVGDITALTASITTDEETLCVLDARAEKLLVYRVQNRNRLELQHVLDLPQAFAEAKGGGQPRPRR